MTLRARIALVFIVTFIVYGCTTTTQAPPLSPPETMRGVASWYGQEFAGRTTANGEIFDPLLLTAAHRSLPFGTIVDVTNVKSGQTVRVRINDRGPYVNNRMIDLSYAAAQQVGLIEPGSGEVELKIVQIGRGDREPPAPFVVTIPDVPVAPIPATAAPAPAPAPDVPVTVERVDVIEQHANQPAMETRRQVAADGRTIETVPVAPSPIAPAPAPTARATSKPAAAAAPAARWVVQVGAFSQEANARALQDRLKAIGQQAFIDRDETLYRVRIGPFATRDQAIAARAKLEANGISAMIVAP